MHEADEKAEKEREREIREQQRRSCSNEVFGFQVSAGFIAGTLLPTFIANVKYFLEAKRMRGCAMATLRKSSSNF